MRIKPGNDSKSKAIAQGKCSEVEVELGGAKVVLDVFFFDLEGIDMVLGISWLASLKGMWVDWGKQIMQFQVKEQSVELKGKGGSYPTQVSLQSLFGKPLRMVDGLFFSTEMHLPESAEHGVLKKKLTATHEQALQDLLAQYEGVFKEPKGLTPKRREEHAIVLLEGQGPVNVRPPISTPPQE